MRTKRETRLFNSDSKWYRSVNRQCAGYSSNGKILATHKLPCTCSFVQWTLYKTVEKEIVQYATLIACFVFKLLFVSHSRVEVLCLLCWIVLFSRRHQFQAVGHERIFWQKNELNFLFHFKKNKFSWNVEPNNSRTQDVRPGCLIAITGSKMQQFSDKPGVRFSVSSRVCKPDLALSLHFIHL